MSNFFAHINDNNIVDTIIPEFDSSFPNVSIDKRYSPYFVERCILIDDSVEVGFIYDKESKTFKNPGVKYDESDTIDDIKEKKIEALSTDCNKAIINGFDFLDEHYSFNLDDQSNIQGSKILADAGIPVPYHPDGGDCREYEPKVFLSLIMAATIHKESHLTYFNQLKQYIKSLDDSNAIKAINYGDELTGSYLEKYNSIITNLKDNLSTAMNSN